MNKCIDPRMIPNKNKHGLNHAEYIQVPCGKCLNCQSAKVSAMTEQILADCRSLGNRAIFVTLTYDDAHAHFLYDNNGKLCMNNQYPQTNLCKEDLQNFLKRFRKNNPKAKFHYVCNGEYGDEGNRAHYHILMWGIGVEYSEEIKRAWTDKDGYLIGRIDVSPPQNMQACTRYILGYMTKEGNEKYYSHRYKELGMQLPFHHISKGIGKEFYLDHIEEIRETQGYYKKDGNMIQVGRYWKNKFNIPTTKGIAELKQDYFQVYKATPSLQEATEFNLLCAKEKYKISKINAIKDHNFIDEKLKDDYQVLNTEYNKNTISVENCYTISIQ